MLARFLLLVITSSAITYLHAQNTSPYWSLTGNSNAAATSKLGTTNGIPFNLVTNNITRIRVSSDGKVGIGTSTPQQRLHVESASNQAIFVSTTAPGTTSGSGMIGSVKAFPTALGNRLGYFLMGSRGGAENGYNAAGMVGYSGGAWTAGSSYPAYLAFETTPSGSTIRQERLRIAADGNIGIGTTSSSARLTINTPTGTNALVTQVNGATKLLAASNGGLSVGSNFTPPSNGLDVTGDVTIRGQVRFTNDDDLPSLFYVNGYGYYVKGLEGTGEGNGVTGRSLFDAGVYGQSDGEFGVYGTGYYGVYGQSTAIDEYGAGVTGFGFDAYGGNFESKSGIGLRAASKEGEYAAAFYGAIYQSATYSASDRKLKENIKEIQSAMSIIDKLKPRYYEYKTEEQYKFLHLPKGLHYGLIAQDVEEVLPNLVSQAEHHTARAAKQPDSTGKFKAVVEDANASTQHATIKAVNYTELIPIIIKGMQEQQAENKALKEEVAELRQMVLELKRGISGAVTSLSGSLEQNTPNPVSGTTTIHYHVGEISISARLEITNAKGQVVKTVNVNKGKGQVNLNTAALAAGTYNYTLYVDGQPADTKRLVIVR